MKFTVEQQKGPEVGTDLFVFGIFKGSETPGGCFSEMDKAWEGLLSRFIQEEWGPNEKKAEVIHSLGKFPAKRVMLVNAGEKEEFDLVKAREVFGFVTKEALKLKVRKVTYCLDSFNNGEEESVALAHALAEASLLASYRFDTYKTSEEDNPFTVEHVSVCVPEGEEEVKQGLETGQIFGEATCFARDLVNTPGNYLTPSRLAEKAVEIASKHGFEYDILDREQMEELGMGALLAVAQGSDQPPKMIVIKYQGKEKWEDVLAFVGKGLTFDTGGISLKPAKDMHEMKMDMGGAAAVLGAMDIIGRLKPKCNVLAVIPSTENMPSGRALKPGDVITSYAGKTIEVRNTDAEGRLILADGIAYAKTLGADYIVDVATLTGAILVALGEYTTGAVTNDETLMIEVLEAANEAGELVWRLPSFEPYKKMVRSSDVADLNNSPGRLAGSITAGLFLGEFAGDTPWVHLDIAGTAWANRETELNQKGGTGAMVRTLATLAERFAD
ncbi:cytosol aminopeptidase [Caldalkalibacillus thermarum TA2.A1]|uniref:Probable cytosol aminopeptidase n=1 Tax=Caldalkalibacillus thermarum (strain TA2.A1) TaxID=986075 RepID=F5L351_CALTT|nr:leucyl aminopeptidase [Caldalkalibacillus thermarum]EGL84232.1 cytosol aminopeptidase [Caldalkalibacillus thermarum TA2.A1]